MGGDKARNLTNSSVGTMSINPPTLEGPRHALPNKARQRNIKTFDS